MSDSKTHEPVVIANAILMTLHTFFAGGVIVQGFIEQNESMAVMFAFGNLATVALQAGLTAYQRGVVVPVSAVVERVNSEGMVIAGPANTVVEPGKPVRPANVEEWSVGLAETFDPEAPEGDHSPDGLEYEGGLYGEAQPR